MRLYRNAIILVVVLGALVGAYFYLNNKNVNEDAKNDDPNESLTVWELDKEKLDRLVIEGAESRIIIENKDQKLVMVEPGDLKYSESKLQDIVSNAAVVIAEKIIEENASDAAKYGFDKPTTITVKMQDEIVKSGQIGDMTPSGSGYYFKEKDNNKIYSISSYSAEQLLATKNDLKEKKLFGLQPEEITGFSLEKGGEIVFSVKQAGTDWNLTAPIEGKAKAAQLDAIIQSALQSNISMFIEEQPDNLDKYGLSNPAYAIEIESNAGGKKLLIGAEKEKGVEYYARFADSSEVFSIDQNNLNFLDRPLKEVVDDFVYIVNIDDVSKIEIDMNGTKAVADIETDKENSENDKFSINGKSVMDIKSGENTGKGLFRVFYQSLIGITFDSLEIGAEPVGKPYLTINYTLKSQPGAVKVEFIPRDDNSFYATKNDKYINLVVGRQQVEHVAETYKALIDAMENAK